MTIFPATMAVPERLLEKGLAYFLMSLHGRETLPAGVVGLTDDGKPMFCGRTLFEMKATHGLPLDFALDRIINEEGFVVDWVAFIDAARRNKWWDFQTYEVICHAMEDSMLPKCMQSAIKERIRLYFSCGQTNCQTSEGEVLNEEQKGKSCETEPR